MSRGQNPQVAINLEIRLTLSTTDPSLYNAFLVVVVKKHRLLGFVHPLFQLKESHLKNCYFYLSKIVFSYGNGNYYIRGTARFEPRSSILFLNLLLMFCDKYKRFDIHIFRLQTSSFLMSRDRSTCTYMYVCTYMMDKCATCKMIINAEGASIKATTARKRQ